MWFYFHLRVNSKPNLAFAMAYIFTNTKYQIIQAQLDNTTIYRSVQSATSDLITSQLIEVFSRFAPDQEPHSKHCARCCFSLRSYEGFQSGFSKRYEVQASMNTYIPLLLSRQCHKIVTSGSARADINPWPWLSALCQATAASIHAITLWLSQSDENYH